MIGSADESGREVVLKIDSGPQVRARFAFNPDGQSLQKAFSDLNVVSCQRDQITEIGQQLFLGSFPGDLRTALGTALALRSRSDSDRKKRVRLRLVVPPDLRRLPWESLFDQQLLHLCIRPDWTLCHEPAREELDLIEFPGPPDDKLKLLIVVPVQTNLDFAPECQAVKRIVDRFGAQAQVEKIEGAVTLQALQDKLAEREWDIVHYIGHGVAESKTGVRVFLNASATGGEAYISESQFASRFIGSGVRLVVLSCCFGASSSSSETRSLTGLGPLLLRAGVPAVVAMRYAVSDRAATEFSSKFYDSLLNKDLGQIDCAVQAGRLALDCLAGESENRAFITPVLYAAPDWVTLPLPASPRRPPDSEVESAISTVVPLPTLLADALRRGECLIIAGGRLANSGATRDLAQLPALSPTLETLARELAHKLAMPYPRVPELDAMQNADDGGAWEVFERVCQYFKSCRDGGRLSLERFVGEGFVSRQPPIIFRLMAGWRVAGIFYTHFDGYLLDAVTSVGDWEIKDTPRQEVSGSRPALVLLRGWPRQLDTLRLTREDAWEVVENISHMSASVKKLARERGSVLLLLGVAPSDALVQFLVNVLLGDEYQRQEKPVFFACAEPDLVVRACWHRFKNLQWLGNYTLEELVRTIDNLVLKRT